MSLDRYITKKFFENRFYLAVWFFYKVVALYGITSYLVLHFGNSEGVYTGSFFNGVVTDLIIFLAALLITLFVDVAIFTSGVSLRLKFITYVSLLLITVLSSFLWFAESTIWEKSGIWQMNDQIQKPILVVSSEVRTSKNKSWYGLEVPSGETVIFSPSDSLKNNYTLGFFTRSWSGKITMEQVDRPLEAYNANSIRGTWQYQRIDAKGSVSITNGSDKTIIANILPESVTYSPYLLYSFGYNNLRISLLYLLVLFVFYIMRIVAKSQPISLLRNSYLKLIALNLYLIFIFFLGGVSFISSNPPDYFQAVVEVTQSEQLMQDIKNTGKLEADTISYSIEKILSIASEAAKDIVIFLTVSNLLVILATICVKDCTEKLLNQKVPLIAPLISIALLPLLLVNGSQGYRLIIEVILFLTFFATFARMQKGDLFYANITGFLLGLLIFINPESTLLLIATLAVIVYQSAFDRGHFELAEALDYDHLTYSFKKIAAISLPSILLFCIDAISSEKWLGWTQDPFAPFQALSGYFSSLGLITVALSIFGVVYLIFHHREINLIKHFWIFTILPALVVMFSSVNYNASNDMPIYQLVVIVFILSTVAIKGLVDDTVSLKENYYAPLLLVAGLIILYTISYNSSYLIQVSDQIFINA